MSICHKKPRQVILLLYGKERYSLRGKMNYKYFVWGILDTN